MRTSNFSVVASSENWNPRTLESIYIQNYKPLLNIDQSATPYHFVNSNSFCQSVWTSLRYAARLPHPTQKEPF